MRIGDTYGGKFFKGEASVTPNPTLTIVGVREHKWEDSDKPQWVIAFQEDDRELGMNKTNAETVAMIACPGTDPDMVDDQSLIGTVIRLVWDPSVSFGSKRTGGIRVQDPGGAAATAPAPTGAVWGVESAARFRKFLIDKCSDVSSANVHLVVKEVGKRCGMAGAELATWPEADKGKVLAVGNAVVAEILSGSFELTVPDLTSPVTKEEIDKAFEDDSSIPF